MSLQRATVAALAAAAVLAGCVTRGQFRRTIAQQRMALDSERTQRLAADSALGEQLGVVRGDVQALRLELDSLRTQYGARISALEDGVHFDMPVNFAFDDATIRAADEPVLDRFARVVQRYYPGSRITVEGFADPAGTPRYNLALSARRADAVRQYLTAHGVPDDALRTVGYGESRLVAPGAWGDQPGAEENRRVVFVIETRGQTAQPVALNRIEAP